MGLCCSDEIGLCCSAEIKETDYVSRSSHVPVEFEI